MRTDITVADGAENGVRNSVECRIRIGMPLETMIVCDPGAAKGHVILVETFAERVGGIAFEDERIRTVRVDLDKLDICPEAEAVGATIERRR